MKMNKCNNCGKEFKPSEFKKLTDGRFGCPRCGATRFHTINKKGVDNMNKVGKITIKNNKNNGVDNMKNNVKVTGNNNNVVVNSNINGDDNMNIYDVFRSQIDTIEHINHVAVERAEKAAKEAAERAEGITTVFLCRIKKEDRSERI